MSIFTKIGVLYNVNFREHMYYLAAGQGKKRAGLSKNPTSALDVKLRL